MKRLLILLIMALMLTGCQRPDLSTVKCSQELFKGGFSYEEVPEYSGEPYAELNGGVPYFTKDEITGQAFERYSKRDDLGRCHEAVACISRELMPDTERGSIGMVKPAGWHTVKYDCIDGRYLYNRCHLIGYQLTGENANEDNLITGTRYLNMTGMLPFEDDTAEYVKETGNHVMYRVTPVYVGDELLARGLIMEGLSVEDDGLMFCVFCYNVQPGIGIDYRTGDSWLAEDKQAGTPEDEQTDRQGNDGQVSYRYIANINTGKFHKPDCPSVTSMKEENKDYLESLEDARKMGYEPCGRCHPE